jgi:hypothetical protein
VIVHSDSPVIIPFRPANGGLLSLDQYLIGFQFGQGNFLDLDFPGFRKKDYSSFHSFSLSDGFCSVPFLYSENRDKRGFNGLLPQTGRLHNRPPLVKILVCALALVFLPGQQRRQAALPAETHRAESPAYKISTSLPGTSEYNFSLFPQRLYPALDGF